jgi:hypothetical protein
MGIFNKAAGISGTLISFLLLAGGCHNSGNGDTTETEGTNSIIKSEVILPPETRNILYAFPTPLEVAIMLQDAKAGYIFNITNPPANVTRYFTEKTKALSLGIYSADLAYSATYNKADETEKFLYCTEKLAKDLGIAGVYDKTLLEKVNAHKNNRDSIVAMVSKVFNQTNDFLNKNNRSQVAVLVATGGFVEGLYLAASLNQVASDNKAITAIILKQKDNLDKLLSILQEYSMDSNIRPVVDEVAKIRPVFTKYGLEAGKNLPRQQAVEIADLTESVRDSMIK